MLTKSDIQKLEGKFVTKEEFHSSMEKVIGQMSDIMGEIQAVREEISVFAYRQSNHSDRIEQLELKTFGKSFI